MAIAITLQEYLDNSGIDYDVLPHSRTSSSISTAEAAQVPAYDVAKSVILEDESGYLMAVIPANHHIELGQLSQQLDRRLGLATEDELATLFADCDVGAIPPVGDAYNMECIVDDCLTDCEDVYFEAGDHTDVVHVRGQDFQRLMRTARHGEFSRRS